VPERDAERETDGRTDEGGRWLRNESLSNIRRRSLVGHANTVVQFIAYRSSSCDGAGECKQTTSAQLIAVFAFILLTAAEILLGPYIPAGRRPTLKMVRVKKSDRSIRDRSGTSARPYVSLFRSLGVLI